MQKIKKIVNNTRDWLKEHIKSIPPVPAAIAIGMAATILYCAYNLLTALIVAILSLVAIFLMPFVERKLDEKKAEEEYLQKIDEKRKKS